MPQEACANPIVDNEERLLLMRGPLIALCFVALSVAWLIFFGAGVRQADWDAALLFLGATALFYWAFRSGQTPPRIPAWQVAALWALPAYAVLQMIPLPPAMLELLSPARSAITESLGGVIAGLNHAPIAIAPAAAMSGFFSLLACLTVYSLMRDLEWRLADTRPWLPVAPLILIAAIEASIGVGQWLGRPQALPVRGTLSSGEHFAGVLEIALPFSLVFGFISFRRHQTQQTGSSLPAARAATSWLAAFMILMALFHSNSATSRIVVYASLFCLLSFAVIPRLKTKSLRLYGTGGVAFIAVAVVLIALSSNDLQGSLAQFSTSDHQSADMRSGLWNSAESLLGEYRLVGAGMGGFESSFPKYQGPTDLNRIQQPHNDVLELLITFGIVGSCIALVVLAGILRPAVLGAIFLQDESRRLLAAAVTAAVAGVMVRSTMEASLSMPAVAMAFGWVAGLSQSSGVD